MVYTGWDVRHDVLAASRWYPITHLVREISAMQRINFSLVEQRQQCLTRLASVACPAPFSIDRRFPACGAYICELSGDWARKFQQLRLALSYKDYSKDPRSSMGHGDSTSISDTIVSYHNVLVQMLQQALMADGTLDRASFEASNLLEWEDKNGSQFSASG